MGGKSREVTGTMPAAPAESTGDESRVVASACQQWQSGRGGGSPRLRAAARALTGVSHYVTADCVARQEQEARRDLASMVAATALLHGVSSAPARDAAGWNAELGLPPRSFAGRVIAASADSDEEFMGHVCSGHLDIPLWSVTLDPEVANRCRGHFRAEIEGPFPGIVPSSLTGLKAQDQAIITGGRYDVVGRHRDGRVTVVRLRYARPVGEHASADPVLLRLLALMPDVILSEVTDVGQPESAEERAALRVRTDAGLELTATHGSGNPDEVLVKRRSSRWGTGRGVVEEETFPGNASELRQLVAALRV